MTLEENKLLFDAVQQYILKQKVLTWKTMYMYICFTCIICYVMNNFNVVQILKLLRRRECTINKHIE